MESAPINVNAGLAQRRALLAKLLAQQQAAGPRGGAFRAGAMGGRPVHNASDLSAAPLPSINVPFRAAAGFQMPGGFHYDPTAPFPGQGGGLDGFAPPPDPPGGGMGAMAGGVESTGSSVPSSYDGPLRGLNPGFTPPPVLQDLTIAAAQAASPSFQQFVPPDPWQAFNPAAGRRGYYQM